MTVRRTIDNGGAATVATATDPVTEPKRDPWVERTPDKDEKPVDNQFYARDDKNEGTLYYNGTLEGARRRRFLESLCRRQAFKTETSKLAADNPTPSPSSSSRASSSTAWNSARRPAAGERCFTPSATWSAAMPT